MELLPDRVSASKLPELCPASSQQNRGQVGFVRGCVMSVLFGDTNHATVRLLNQTGYDVITPSEQVCCGALFSHGGQLEKARECARFNIAAFEKIASDTIIINAAGCGSSLKEYGHLLAGEPAWADRARAFSAKVRDLTEFLIGARVSSPAATSETRTALQ